VIVRRCSCLYNLRASCTEKKVPAKHVNGLLSKGLSSKIIQDSMCAFTLKSRRKSSRGVGGPFFKRQNLTIQAYKLRETRNAPLSSASRRQFIYISQNGRSFLLPFCLHWYRVRNSSDTDDTNNRSRINGHRD
jgi:hypothetical protein